LNVVTTSVRAADQTAVDEATKAADQWLKLVDNGDYKQSWETASTIFKNAVTEDQWAQQVGSVKETARRAGLKEAQERAVRYQSSRRSRWKVRRYPV